MSQFLSCSQVPLNWTKQVSLGDVSYRLIWNRRTGVPIYCLLKIVLVVVLMIGENVQKVHKTLPSYHGRAMLVQQPLSDGAGGPLQWRHNACDGVSNHQPHDCLLMCLFRSRSKKTSKPRITVLCEGNPPVIGKFPAQRASNVENVSIPWRHHVVNNLWRQVSGPKGLRWWGTSKNQWSVFPISVGKPRFLPFRERLSYETAHLADHAMNL